MSAELTLRLHQLKPGQRGRIARVVGNDHISQRLLEMGLLEGDFVEVLALAPLGDPIEVKVSDYRLSLRRSEAERVCVLLEPGHG
ncbi:MAG: FeoA family protein [Gemmatales bacterium]|nr:ferrous iron transport protein A [Gemmatales bacterium]MDW7995656.1 FeoA family protein [Gemmatales bacterium]